MDSNRRLRFQSAPRPFDRGDVIAHPSSSHSASFNPRPGLSTGAIRSARRLETDRCPLRLFQSAPRPFDRGDTSRSAARFSAFSSCFNPRPGLSTGAMNRHRQVSLGRSIMKVSIRAPAFRPGRSDKPYTGDSVYQFQSAPRPFDRGDFIRELWDRRKCVSIRAPAFRPGRFRSGRSRGGGSRVSIRAPAFRPGRSLGSRNYIYVLWFQSAPRPFDRGDRAAP